MKMKWLVFAAVTFLMLSGALRAQSKRVHSPEQTVFSAEDVAVKKPVAIPLDVWAILMKDKMVKSEAENQEPPAEKVPAAWFSASAIHLSNIGKTDLVVMATGPLAGANVDVFWVFRGTAHGHELVMMAPTHGLVVKKTRWKGYRDIELTSMSAVKISTVLCRFDGRQYKEYKSKIEDIQ